MLPLLMAVGGLGVTAYGLVSSAAPSGGGAIDTMLTAKATAARQCVFKNYPSLELPQNSLVATRLKGIINTDYFYRAMAKNGINTARANILLEDSKALLTLEDLITAWYHGNISRDNYYKKAARLGYDSTEAEIALGVKRAYPNFTNLLDAYWRGYISKKEYYSQMKAAGYMEEDSDLLEHSQLFIPSHEDLIRFQVRDVYNNVIVDKYGYNEEFPTNILPDAHKIGMSEEVMRNYWKAHWDLPSPTMAYNMVQRLNPEVLSVVGEKYQKMGLDYNNLKTDIDTLKELLKIADYPKYWRDRMVAISYDPITRVDLRRIYQLGLCTDKFVVATLQEHGYSHEDASLMLEFYKTLKGGKDKKLTEKNSIDSYNYGLLSKNETITKLKDLGYDLDEIDIKLELNKRLLAEKDLKDKISVWTVDYVKGIKTDEDIKTKLTLEGVNDKKATIILSKMKAAKKKAVKSPPLNDLHKFYTKNLLDETGYRAALSDYGIENRYIDLYVIMNKPGTETG